jgi:hypothetical protein
VGASHCQERQESCPVTISACLWSILIMNLQVSQVGVPGFIWHSGCRALPFLSPSELGLALSALGFSRGSMSWGSVSWEGWGVTHFAWGPLLEFL